MMCSVIQASYHEYLVRHTDPPLSVLEISWEESNSRILSSILDK
jgi:hypothetical protein